MIEHLKYPIVALLLLHLLSFCKGKATKEIRIDIYQCEPSNIVYKDVYKRDSITKLLLYANPPDTDSLSVSELLQLNDTALRRNPILNRLREIVNQNKEGNYQFKDPAIIGNADLFDTAFISFWINRSQNMESKTSFAYKWVTESDNKNEAFLIALEKQAPVFRYSQLDLDSVVLEPFYGILEQISKFTGEKPDPSSYTLKMVFKLESITSLKKWITADTTHPYIAIISSGPFKYCFTIRRTALLKNNCFRSVTSIDPKKLRDFKDKFGGPIFEMPH